MASPIQHILGSAASGATGNPIHAATQARENPAGLNPARVIQASQAAAELKSAETKKVVPEKEKKKVDKSPNLDPKRKVPGKQAKEEDRDQGEGEKANTGHLDVVA